ncbi:flagellar protein FlaG [Sporosarcina sp. YIM B06819]|uniref:flagellar protein FlaG n=1 Tax=Sporosarcina sp. YIM B06819 TaxID=3081769 RepID=UPI00298C03F3|nr:flagellar protein FlaG [Sporosarcina sp. YIM B06819]
MVGRIDGSTTMHRANISVEKAVPDMEVSEVQVQTVAEKAQPQADQEQRLPADKAKQLTDSMNTFLASANTQLRFKFHDKLNEYYVTIVDSKTDEVIREIPSKKLLDFHAAMREFVGMLVDRKI